MKKFLPFSKRQPSLDRFSVQRGGWAGSDRFNGKSLRRTSATSLNTRSIQVVRGAYNIDLNKVDSSFTKLHRACLMNDDAQVRKHLLKVDNNSHDTSNRYPIHLATVNGNFTIVKLLIENQANPNVQDNEGNTPLIKSIQCGHEHLVKYLLSNGANPNLCDLDNNTALHWALITESMIAVDALMSSKKCDLALKNCKEETCLHLAVRSPIINTATFDAMIRGGSDLNALDQFGLTAMDIAQASNNKVAINALKRYYESSIPKPKKVDDKDDNNLNEQLENIQKICEEYKQKYAAKNQENLENEKRLIKVNSQLERLKFDMTCVEEQNLELESKIEKLTEENSKLKAENSDFLEQINRLAQSSSTQVPENTRDTIIGSLSKNHELSDIESIHCRSYEAFLAEKKAQCEKISKLTFTSKPPSL